MNPAAAKIAREIAARPQQRLTFAEFMDLALYDPECGYYSSGRVAIGGAGGDFFTSASLGPDFGELLAEQFAQLWELLGTPEPFTLLEMGAGTGALAADILGYSQRQLPAFFAALHYTIVERSPMLRQRQQERLAPWCQACEIRWLDWSEIAADSLLGCAFANELIDALPVHLVEVVGDRLQEIYVACREDQFVEVRDALSTPELAAYFPEFGLDIPGATYPQGYRTEVNLAARRWLATVASKLQRGYLLTIDYGYPAAKYYHPQRSRGTLQCYSRHRRHSDPYTTVGECDITAHINFTDLERYGAPLGLEPVGFTQQGLFLMALGLGDRLANLAATCADPGELLRRRDALHQAIDPSGLGNFGVLLQGKNLPAASREALPRGWQEPPWP